jgi:inosine/xanthosine triphosphate pyrophosphatase family protein
MVKKYYLEKIKIAKDKDMDITLYQYKLIMCDIEIEEIQSVSVEEVIQHKLDSVLSRINSSNLYTNNYMVEDTGLFINSKTMNGFPGALVKFYLNFLEVDGICKMNKNEPCEAVTYIGYWDSNTQTKQYFNGKIKGKIAYFPSGKNGLGYDGC